MEWPDYLRLVLEGALKQLTPIERDCVRMRYLQSMSYREIETQLNKSYGAVHEATARGLEKLYRQLKDNPIIEAYFESFE